jgi:hypothetical protein
MIAPVTLTGRFVRLEPLTATQMDALEVFAYEPSLWTWTAARVTDRASLAAFVDGARRDTAWYSIVDDEWPAVKVRLEHMLGGR